MLGKFKQLEVERLSGILTIFTIAGIANYLAWQNADIGPWRYLLANTSYLVYLYCFVRTTNEDLAISNRLYMGLVTLQFASVVALFFCLPNTFNAILLGIWSGHLVYLLSLKLALASTPVLFVGFYAIFKYHWQFDFVIFSALLYWMLSLFTVTMIHAVRQESIAKEASQQLNRELLAAQSLLKEATKQSERVRIARNIHDLVGHHLTALTINLQVAMHKTEGDAKQQVEKSYAIAKLLLADVREAVTEIREKSALELSEALKALVESVPRLKIHLQLQEDLAIADVELADTILRCVQESLTNTLKHGHANEFHIKLRQQEEQVQLTMQDNGKVSDSIKPGNGLTGIKERVAALGGKVDFQADKSGFRTFITMTAPA